MTHPCVLIFLLSFFPKYVGSLLLFPNIVQNFADLKKELILQGQNYAKEALTYRTKIAELAFGFIKDGSVVGYPNAIT